MSKPSHEEDFERGWEAVRRWMRAVDEGVEAGSYDGARGFVLYLAGGRRAQ